MLRAILFFTAVLLALPSVAAAADRSVDRSLAEYRNDRFGSAILYRDGYFQPEPPSKSADGRVFRSAGGAELLVAAISSTGQTLSEVEATAKVYFTGGRITYRRVSNRGLVLSGYDEKGRIVYVLKGIYKAPPGAEEAGDVVATLLLIYPASERRPIDSDLGPTVRHFYGRSGCALE